MGDPQRGFEADSTYSVPANALVVHPGLLLLVGGFGIMLAVFAPLLCNDMFNPTRCENDLRLLGLGIGGLGLIPFTIVSVYRLVMDDPN